MDKKAGIVLVITGAALLLSALLLFLYSEYEEYRAGQNAELVLDDIQTAVEARQSPKKPSSEPSEPKTLLIDGYEYIGYISIPDLQIVLPVMAEWDYERLKIAPCRHFGASETDDLVIAAHSYKTHFGLIHRLKTGAEIIFTDMDGVQNNYTLKRLETVSPDSVDAVKNSEYALVLYTCTPDAENRVTAFCERVTDVPDSEKADK